MVVQKIDAKVPADHLPIYRLEGALLQFPQVDMPVQHEFCAGLYARTMHIPAGTVLTGAVHREESFFLVRKGDLMVSAGDGTARAVTIASPKVGTIIGKSLEDFSGDKGTIEIVIGKH